MGVHLDKSETSVGLEARLDDKPKVLEERNDVIRGGVRSEVADIACSLPVGSLSEDNIIAADAMCRELVVAEGSSRRQAHSLHRLLLSHGRLALLVGPVAANSA